MANAFPSISDLTKKPIATGKKKVVPKDIDSPLVQFDEKMEEISIKEKETETQVLAASAGAPYINLAAFPISAEALKAIPEEVAREKKIICFYFTADEIRLGVVDLSVDYKEFIYQLGERFHTENIIVHLISEHSLERVFKLYASLPVIKPITKDINITDEELGRFQTGLENLQAIQESFKKVSITDIVTLIIASALKVRSSDIHIEAEEDGVVIRYRIDGVLHEIGTLPKDLWKRFVSRIKLLSALKINVNDVPQDGRVTLKLTSGSLDIRVSTLPTTWGESVVMRILHSGNKGVTYDELGIRGLAYVRLKREIERPNGMIITTGPTGSGKTTTLYAILRTLNKPGVKIVTMEDPVEIKMEGINQSQVDISKDYTFAKGLRSILRQDPDICMVGEIRDLESAEISIQAALTGHLLLSTIHTNSAAGTIPRFLSMGVKPFLLAPSLNAVIGQRLVRRVCEHCVEEEELTAEMLERVGKIIDTLPAEDKLRVQSQPIQFYKGKGCTECSGLGYKGRIGIYEIFTMTKEIETVILSGKVSEYDVQALAVKDGMITMAQDGILKALDKITTVDEVFRVSE